MAPSFQQHKKHTFNTLRFPLKVYDDDGNVTLTIPPSGVVLNAIGRDIPVEFEFLDTTDEVTEFTKVDAEMPTEFLCIQGWEELQAHIRNKIPLWDGSWDDIALIVSTITADVLNELTDFDGLSIVGNTSTKYGVFDADGKPIGCKRITVRDHSRPLEPKRKSPKKN